MSTKKNEETTPMKKIDDLEATRPSASIKNTPAASDENKFKLPKGGKKTQPVKPTVASEPPIESSFEPTSSGKPKRALFVWLGILGLLVIIAGGCLIGYGLAIRARQAEDLNQRLTAATAQYVLSLQDIENNNLPMAKTRLEYVIQVYPDYPEAGAKLTEVMVALAQNNQLTTSAPVIATVAPTMDTRNLEAIYSSAQQYLVNQDWANLLASVNSIRNTDPTFKSVQVDGLYYLALRNVALSKINSGKLETGIYYLTLASKIGPIDAEAQGYYTNAALFLNAGAGFGATWDRALNGFEMLNGINAYMIDVNGITVRQRYAESLAGYGDLLQSEYDWCGARDKYLESLAVMTLQSVSAILPDAEEKCANPPSTPTPTLEPGITPTPEN
jgi:hypothetical protein